MKRRICSALMAALFLLTGASARAEGVFGAWLPYWRAEDALEETAQLLDRLDRAVAFAAIFDSSDRVLMLGEAEDLLLDLQVACAGSEAEVYLSVVNDQETGDGQYDNKSRELLWRLLASEETMNRHIDDLLLLMDTYRVEALEIDYENMKNDTALWERFSIFIEKLYHCLSAEGKSLRVVLSWDAPKYASLPEGPEYTVMCYNLYGYHSGPGPKADFEFLEQVAALYQEVPGTVRMALATGGYEWLDGSVTRELTQREAEELLSTHGVEPLRDRESGVLYGRYTSQGRRYTVWYADGETLALWKEHLAGFDGYDLFCLSGNHPEDWLGLL